MKLRWRTSYKAIVKSEPIRGQQLGFGPGSPSIVAIKKLEYSFDGIEWAEVEEFDDKESLDQARIEQKKMYKSYMRS